jgi:hypothetical protein
LIIYHRVTHTHTTNSYLIHLIFIFFFQDQVAVDFVQPVLQDLVRTLNKADAIAPGFDRSPLQKWLGELNKLRAVDLLTDEQRRQLILDLDNGFQQFMQALRREG